MNRLLEHAKKELLRVELDVSEHRHILEIVQVFTNTDYDLFSSARIRAILNKLLEGLPLTPLTGEDEEWDKEDQYRYQNKRCRRVFKDIVMGELYDIYGTVFERPDGSCYTNVHSRVPVVFPYTPKTEYVDDSSEIAYRHQDLTVGVKDE